MKPEKLHSPVTVGNMQLPHRVVMAPLTRARSAQPGDIPQQMNVTYYAQRATAALIISEATQISPQGKGYAFTPGIHSEKQIAGWKKVTDAVHAKGSKMFLQIWHVGRISHTSLQLNGEQPVAPSAIAADGQAFTHQGPQDFQVPRELRVDEIPGIIEQYKQAARNAEKAGFDGVEIHGGNGYLLDQFLRDGTNFRGDDYGGVISNRIRLTLEVVQGVVDVLGADRVGIRISPTSTFNSMKDSNPQQLFERLVEALNQFDLAYLHVVEDMGEFTTESFDFNKLRQLFNGAYIANGGYSAESAESTLLNNNADLVAFGVPFIANPDLPNRMRLGAELNQPDPDTFYGGGEKGYIDYPTLSDLET